MGIIMYNKSYGSKSDNFRVVRKEVKKIDDLGYGWAIYVAKFTVNTGGTLYLTLVTNKSKIVYIIYNSEFYKLNSTKNDDLTGKVSPKQFVDRYGVYSDGTPMNYKLYSVTLKYVKNHLPVTIYQNLGYYKRSI